ncbi:MAG: hypothetical protein JO340_16315 [Acidobacteriaceae bacterium]|nr:hypothetical protein [Acidobacteriaceae bacterium]
MPSTKEALSASEMKTQRSALEAVLRSRTFAKNPRLSALLEYVCSRCYRGEADAIKEYNIATDVFGRPATFDQSQDAIVRVEMHRLRKKLGEFYATEGHAEPVQIVIQSGHYLPEFVHRNVPSDNEQLSFESPRVSLPLAAEKEIVSDNEAIVAGQPPRWLFWAAGSLLVIALLTVVALFRPGRANPNVPAQSVHTPLVFPDAALLPSETVHILCGASQPGRDRQGNLWSADAFYSGGSVTSFPDPHIFRTRDSFLFRSARTGEFSYKIPLKPGVYEMRLYFADQSYIPGVTLDGGEGTRVFDISVNHKILLRELDIIAEAGAYTADVRVSKDITPAADGFLHLDFSKVQGAPLLNAIELDPGIPHRLRPIRIVTQDRTITDRSGVVWHSDDYFLNGRGIVRSSTVSGTEDPQIYECERYGNFSYSIPVSAGRYAVSLHFAESYWGPNSPGGGGPGTRIFDVYCNGVALLRSFDMLKEAAPRTQIVKTFHNLQANAQGKLLLSFVPDKNYANLSAVEVIDEAGAP